jgi:hypothetical protein
LCGKNIRKEKKRKQLIITGDAKPLEAQEKTSIEYNQYLK